MDLIHSDLSRKIIGAAMEVINILKPGLDEKLYERALCLELEAMGYQVSQQKRFPVFYRNEDIGVLVPDLIVEEKVIVDTKVVSAFSAAHIAQMTGYLVITGLQLGLLLNFKNEKLEWKRIVRQQSVK